MTQRKGRDREKKQQRQTERFIGRSTETWKFQMISAGESLGDVSV